MFGLQRTCTLLLCLLTGSVHAGDFIYTVGNQLFTENTIYGFKILQDGSLRKTPGSPYATGGGTGQGTPPFTQNGIVATEDGQFILACNLFSNDISIFKVLANGRLELMNVAPTGGYTPASIALQDDIVYVSHLGTSFAACYFCDYRGYRFDREAATLTPIPDSIIELPLNPPGFALAIQFTPDGRHMVTTRFTESKIDSFLLDPASGLLSHTDKSPYKAEDTQPIGFAFNPVNPRQFFVSNVRELDKQPGTMSAYNITEEGEISLVPGGPYTTGGEGAACWVAITSDGKNLYTTNTRTDSITRYKIRPDGTLNFKDVTPVPNIDEENDEPLDIIITRDDRYLFTVNGGVPGIVGYRINGNGSLELLPGTQPRKLPKSTAPFGLVYVTR